jgi:hypothetical protein
MGACSLLACLMLFLQETRERAHTRDQIQLRADSQDLTWMYQSQRSPPVLIRDPFWSRGIALHQTKTRRVWFTPSYPGRALGHTYSVAFSVDF